MTTSDQQPLSFDPILSQAALFRGAFSIDWLIELSHAKVSTILQVLGHAERKGWIKTRQPGQYEFTREAQRRMVQQCLESRRAGQACRQAVVILRRELPGGPDKSIALAELLLKMTNDLQGCRELLTAGDTFRKAFKTVDALACYAKILDDTANLDRDEETDRLTIAATLQYSKLSSATEDAGRIVKALQKAIAVAAERDLKAQWSLLKMHLAKQQWQGSRFQAALKHFNEGWACSGTIDDENHQRAARIFSMYFLYWQGRFKEAVAVYEASVPKVEQLPASGFPLMARLTIGSCYAHCGDVSQGIGMLDAIREHCLKSGNMGIASHALAAIALILCETGRIEEAFRHFQTALDQSLRGHNILVRVSALLGLAYSHHLMGQPHDARDRLREFITWSRKTRMELRNYPMVLEMCWAMASGKLPPMEGLSLDDEIRRAMKSGNVYMRGIAYQYRARQRRLQNRSVEKARPDLRKACALLTESGHRLRLASAQMDLAGALFNSGKEEEAMAMAAPAAQYLLLINKSLVPEEIHHLIKNLRSEKNLLEEMMSLSQELVTLQADRDLIGQVISAAARLTSAERGAIFVKENQSHDFILKAAKNLETKDVSCAGFARSRELIAKTYDTAEGRLVDLELPPGRGEIENPIRSCICVPMLLRKQVIGVLYLDNRLFSSAFMASDIKILDYFAAQASIAMENAKAYALLQDQYLKQKEEKQHYEQQYLERLNFEDIVGHSNAMQRVFKRIESVAATDATVLILGETGVGKELVARAIHRNSLRKKGPFIRVNCSAFSEHLIASELFGHERGAFTGADRRYLGRFELADGGTLFLDEIGDIPMAVQVRLLRVLQSKEFERVGGQTTLRSDFRLMAATNKKLTNQVRIGEFRQDLYYRLNVFPIEVPPLRRRREDTTLLTEHFLAKFCRQHNKSIDKLSADDIKRLNAYPWPGNVRELENLIERAVILCRGSRLRLPEMTADPSAIAENERLMNHAENERTHIIRVLKRTGGRISGPNGAAAILEIPPNTLRYRIKKLSIQNNDWTSQ